MPKRQFRSYSKFPRRRGLTKKQKQQVRRIAYKTGEQKYQPHGWGSTSINNLTGLSKPMWYIPQGDNMGERDGDVIHMDRLVMELVLTMTQTTNIVRVIVATHSDPALGPASFNTICPSVYAAPVWEDFGVKIFRDFLVTGGSGGPVSKRIKLNVPLKKRGQRGMKVTYTGSGTTTAVGSPQLLLWFISDSGTSTPTVTGHGRLWYHDN